ncbi:hypothetical protein BGZ63DRAFT_446156 [Mariannaea sp. PMI_226]|nr:hypothetical protein BGZ63DRAFT_446156 [Mariannaea sp. PMI_226]
MLSLADSTFPLKRVALIGACPGGMMLCAITTCFYYLALGSDVAVFVTLEALSDSALSVIFLAVVVAALPYKSLLDNSISVFGLGELNNNR